MNFIAIGIELVLVGDPLYCYVVKLVLVEIGYVVLTSTQHFVALSEYMNLNRTWYNLHYNLHDYGSFK